MSEIVNRIETGSGILGMQRPFVYFGYGLESVPEVMDTILGRSVTAEFGVTAIKQQLCVQEIDQVPDVPAGAFGGKSPQAILSETWQRFTDSPFSSYVLKETENRGDIVAGTLYKLDVEDMLRVNHWDLTAQPVQATSGSHSSTYPGWRYLNPLVELADGRQVQTLTVYPEQEVDRVVPGTDYDPFINDEAVTMQVVRETMDQLDQ